LSTTISHPSPSASSSQLDTDKCRFEDLHCLEASTAGHCLDMLARTGSNLRWEYHVVQTLVDRISGADVIDPEKPPRSLS
jgi:hypothetical protein